MSQVPRSVRRRTLAASTLLGLVLTVAATVFTAVDPARLGRWAARIQVAVEGGVYQGREGVVLQSTLSDCGPAALANMIRVLGLGEPATDVLGALAGTGPAGTRASGLVRAAEVFGLSLTLNRLRHGDIAEMPKPFIAWVRKSHFVTVTEWTPAGQVTVLDPQVGRYTIDEEAFSRLWSGEAVVLRERTRPSAARAVAEPRSLDSQEEALGETHNLHDHTIRYDNHKRKEDQDELDGQHPRSANRRAVRHPQVSAPPGVTSTFDKRR